MECCEGSYQAQAVGPTDECTWEYTGYGERVECGRSDEVSCHPAGDLIVTSTLFRFSWADAGAD